jgi:putative transcriptional regulator
MTPAQILQLRTDLGLSQVDFAQLFGAHFMTISKWERGRAFPSSYQLALMQQFRVKADAAKMEAEKVKNLLVGAGVVAALMFLLS